MKNSRKRAVQRNIISLSLELQNMWTNASMIEKYTFSFLDNLTDVNHTVFCCIKKELPGDWSSAALVGELVKGNINKVLIASNFN